MMARYIDADALLSRLPDDLPYKGSVKRVLMQAPTADVVKLPCNVGDSCYPLPSYKTPIVERKVSRITFSKRNIIIGYYENDGQYRPPLRTRILGDDVFLTREEAEEALRKEREK